MQLKHWDGDGTLLYTSSVQPPRSASPLPTPTPPPTPSPTPTPAPSPSPEGSCRVGDNVLCPGGHHCKGNQCCRDLSTCPSADNGHLPGCRYEKAYDCTVAEYFL